MEIDRTKYVVFNCEEFLKDEFKAIPAMEQCVFEFMLIHASTDGVLHNLTHFMKHQRFPFDILPLLEKRNMITLQDDDSCKINEYTKYVYLGDDPFGDEEENPLQS